MVLRLLLKLIKHNSFQQGRLNMLLLLLQSNILLHDMVQVHSYLDLGIYNLQGMSLKLLMALCNHKGSSFQLCMVCTKFKLLSLGMNLHHRWFHHEYLLGNSDRVCKDLHFDLKCLKDRSNQQDKDLRYNLPVLKCHNKSQLGITCNLLVHHYLMNLSKFLSGIKLELLLLLGNSYLLDK